MADWENGGAEDAPPTDEIGARTAIVAARLKSIYMKSVLPCEKKYQYDYFYESPLLTDVDFDGKK
jgi:EH domain-containing protein 1